jgi:glycosyltransferase involved in cell wall biosynthesis
MKISGIIIAKNEENLIADAIESLKFCDEIVVIDNGSEDRTADLAKKMGAKVFEVKTQDFSQLRELGMEKAEAEWIFYLDADERVSNELAQEIKYRVTLTEFSAYKLPRMNYYLGKNLWPKVEYLERLFEKKSLKGWSGKLHESPEFEGKSGKLENPIVHFTHRDLESMLNKTISWSDIEAAIRFEKKHPRISWWRFPRVMIPTFFRYFLREGGYKLGVAGLVESMFQTFSVFVTYAKLWEKQRNS